MAIRNTGWGSVAQWPTTARDVKNTGWGSIAQWPAPTPAPTPTTPVVDGDWNAQWRAAVAAEEARLAALRAAEAEEANRRTSAMDEFRAFFGSLGVAFDAELEGILFGAMMKGMTPDDMDLLLPDIQKTAAFNNRFTGYQAYKANHQGSAINLQTYLDLERSYTDILRNAGMPSGFYDDYSDLGNWIAKGISPEELSGRVRLATDAAQQVDPTMRNLMARFYGLTTGDVASYFLDPNRAMPIIEHQYKTAEVASWAQRNGYAVTDMKRYEELMTSGVTGAQAAQGYATVRQLDDTVGRIAGIYGESYGQGDAEQDVFFNNNEKRRRIVSQEQATFGGSSRGSTGSAQRSSY